MTLAPLLTASLSIQIHVVATMLLISLTIAIFTTPRGRGAHKTLGYAWVILMMLAALSSFWINEIRILGPFSPIHLISLYVATTICVALYAARTKKIALHRKAMKGMVYGGLIGAGAFTLLPGRIMNAVLLGG